MEQSLSPELVRSGSQPLPGWVIRRAADYMVRRYGRAAMRRAVSRQKFLSEHGEREAAALWAMVAEAIRATASPLRKPRG
jgi:hypothetical protein